MLIHLMSAAREKGQLKLLKPIRRSTMYYRLKISLRVIAQGKNLSDKIILFISIFYSALRYLVNKAYDHSAHFGYYSLTGVMIKNSDGLFYCRGQTNDPLIVSELHEWGLRKYYEELQPYMRGGAFIDVGAHIGKYTCKVARQLQNVEAKVISIEAHPQNFGILKKNIKLNTLTSVIPLNVACCQKNGKVELYWNRHSNNTAGYSIADKSENYVTVEAMRLSDILGMYKVDRVDFMKIDVDGAELGVLEGAEEFLSTHKILRIIFEATPECLNGCEEFLQNNGYVVERIGFSYYLAYPKP